LRKGKVAFELVIIVIGIAIAGYSSAYLQGQEVLFNENSVLIDSSSYVSYEITVNLEGKLMPTVVGGVGSVGNGVDFYLVNDTSWNAWSANPDIRNALSVVHLNSTEVSSQSIEGQFSFSPTASVGYSVVFSNNDYPNAIDTTVNATITLQYLNLYSIYGLIIGLVVFGLGCILFAHTARKRGPA
jgi:hypothetical protein